MGQSKKCGPAVSAFRKKYDKTPEGRARLKKHSEHLSKMYKDNPEKFQKWIEAGLSSTSRKWHDTKPELQMAAILDELGIKYVKQHREPLLSRGHRNHKWDFRLLDVSVLLEIDGCFWHGCPKHTSKSRRAELKESAKKELDRDVEADLSGWIVLRFWEHEFDDAPGDVARCVVDVMNRSSEVAA